MIIRFTRILVGVLQVARRSPILLEKLRTIRLGIAPSRGVVLLVPRKFPPEFLSTDRKNNTLAKHITRNLDLDRAEG